MLIAKKTVEIFTAARNGCILSVSGILLAFYVCLLVVILMINSLIPVRRVRRRVVMTAKRFSYHLIVSLFVHWFPNPVYIRYDKRILNSCRTITISNHCSDYDWVFLLLLFHELKLHDSKILLKKSVGEVPLLGFIIRRFGHICLNRSKVRDIKIIEKAVSKITRDPEYNIALYPEGTYIFSASVERNQEYARDAHIVVDDEPFIPKLVLLPRKTGFDTITSGLSENYDGIVDVTIMMNPYVYMPSEDCPPYDMFIKQTKAINQFLLVDFVPREEITSDFLERSFKKKETRIRAYIDYTQDAVDTEGRFRDILEHLEPTSETDVIRTLYLRSRYRPLVYIFPMSIALIAIFSVVDFRALF